MSHQLWSSDIDRFLAHLLASQLVTQSTLEQACVEWQTEWMIRKNLDSLCERLVGSDILTQWQCQQLRDGKYWGFFVDDYRIEEYLRTDGARDKYLACEKSTGQRVILEVQSPAIARLHNGRLAYRVNRAPGVRQPEGNGNHALSPLEDPQVSVFFSDAIRTEPDRKRMLAELPSITVGDLPPGAQRDVRIPADEPSETPSWRGRFLRIAVVSGALLLAVGGGLRLMWEPAPVEKIGNLYDVMTVGMTANRVETAVHATRSLAQWQDSRAFVDDGGFIRYPLGSGAYLVVRFDSLYDPGNILPEDRIDSFRFIHFDDLRGEVREDLLPLVRRIHLASFNGFNLQPVELIQTVNELYSAGKELAIDALTDYYNLARNDTDRAWQYNLDKHRIFLLARLLFVPKDNRGQMAVAHLDTNADDLKWTGNNSGSLPLIVIDDIPLSLLSGYRTAGQSQSPSAFLKYCRSSCRLRSRPLTPTISPIKTIEHLVQSKHLKRLVGNSFLLTKSLLRVQATRCVDGVVRGLPADYQKQLNCNLVSSLEADSVWRTIRNLDKKAKITWNVDRQEFGFDE